MAADCGTSVTTGPWPLGGGCRRGRPFRRVATWCAALATRLGEQRAGLLQVEVVPMVVGVDCPGPAPTYNDADNSILRYVTDRLEPPGGAPFKSVGQA